jgi:hypothetical protein
MIDLVECPEAACTHHAEVLERYMMEGTDGPVAMVRVRCLTGHYFNMAAWMLKEAS